MNDTIVALSSPPFGGAGTPGPALAIVRLSGSRAFELSDGVFKIIQPESHARLGAKLFPPNLIAAALEKRWRRLPGAVVWRGAHSLRAHAYAMPAPRSYTREDVVELHVPAMSWLLDELLDALNAAGARPAQPGEFTRRAFENGRISLEQAEAVSRLISSTSAAEARAHAQRLTSHVDADRRALKSGIEDLLAKVELGLDFAHEDVIVIAPEEISARINSLLKLARKLSDSAAREVNELPAKSLPRVVLAGPTNAGKSRLFNALLKRDAAIVSAERHTTRDAVEATLALGNSSALIIDSAGVGVQVGVHASACSAESAPLYSAAWSASLRAIRGADLLLIALDNSIAPEQQEGLAELLREVESLRDIECVLVRTKSDLPTARSADSWPEVVMTQFAKQFTVSSVSGEGLDALREFLGARIAEISTRSSEAHSAAGAALRSSARTIAESLERALLVMENGDGEDALAVELREAIHACWQAEGILIRHDAVTEAALDRIFSEFCIGK